MSSSSVRIRRSPTKRIVTLMYPFLPKPGSEAPVCCQNYRNRSAPSSAILFVFSLRITSASPSYHPPRRFSSEIGTKRPSMRSVGIPSHRQMQIRRPLLSTKGRIASFVVQNKIQGIVRLQKIAKPKPQDSATQNHQTLRNISWLYCIIFPIRSKHFLEAILTR